MKNFVLEGPGGIPGLKQVPSNGQVTTSTAWVFSGAVTFNGAVSGITADITVPLNMIGSNAAAFSVAKAGVNYAFNVDTSTASAATGLNIKAAAAGSGLAVSTISSGTNENLTIDAKGTGTVTINGTASGIVVLPAGTTIGGSVPLTSTITSSSANALVVGQNGATNPAFQVDASTSTSATGLAIKSAAAAAGVALTVISSGTDENLAINAKGAGTITLASVSTGRINMNQQLDITSSSANALVVGRQGLTNPVLQINANTATVVTGLKITGAASGAGLALATISSSSNEALTIAALGTGTVTFNPAVVATAGGAVNDGIQFGSISVGVYTGTGTPTFSAMNGSIYVDSNATTTTTRIYVNKSGAGTAGTTWTNLTTAA